MFTFFAGQLVKAPSSFELLAGVEVVVNATLRPEGKDRLQLIGESVDTRISCSEAQAVCLFVGNHPAAELNVIVAEPELLPVPWLVSARSREQVLLPLSESESRLKFHKYFLIWTMFLVGGMIIVVILNPDKVAGKKLDGR